MPDEQHEDTPYREDSIEALRKKVQQLEVDNRRYRRRVKGQPLEPADSLPKGWAALNPADAARWEALNKIEAGDPVKIASRLESFAKLGGEPAEIGKRLKRGEEAEGELTQLKQEKEDRAVAELAGYKASVWSDLRKSKGLATELRDQTVEEDGRQVVKKVPHVRPAGDEKAQWQLLAAFAESELADYLPALKADGGESKPNGVTKPAQQWPKQTGTEKPASSSDKAAAFLERRAAASSLEKSPLAKAAGLK